MKLPSFSHLTTSFANGLKRFPLQILIAIIATLCWCWYIRLETDYSLPDGYNMFKQNLLKVIFVLNLALVLSLAAAFFAERRRLSATSNLLLNMGSIVFCILLYFVLDIDSFSDGLRILFLSFSFHLLVAYAPFIGKGNMNGFWQFNKALFLRFLASTLYSLVLFLGLAAALAAVNALFNASFGERTFMSLFAIIGSGFNTIFFLSGLPVDFEALDLEENYPKGLKVFTQFVLIPLMTIYLAILLVYEIKIIMLWQMPKGMVSMLILGYAVFGILSLLLVYPIKDTVGNSWIKMFSRFFYIMMVPLLVLLLLAIWKRVGHYGITESRYVLIALALWLSGITLYFLFSKKQNIKVIPVSLSIIALLAVYGPQSAFSVSKYSQLARLKRVLKSTDENEQHTAYSIVEYLVKEHGLESLQPFTKTDMKALDNRIEKSSDPHYTKQSNKVDSAAVLLNLKYRYDYSPEENPRSRRYVAFINSNNELLNVSGYDYVFKIEGYERNVSSFDSINLKINILNKDKMMTLKVNDAELMKVDLVKLYSEGIMAYKKNASTVSTDNDVYNYPAEKMTFTKENGKYKFTILLTNMSGNVDLTEDEQNYNGINATGYLLIKKL